MLRRSTKKRPVSKKRSKPKAFSAGIILPALLVGAVIGFMPSMLTGSLSWSWFTAEPAVESMEVVTEPVMVDVGMPDPACCVGSAAYYDYSDVQCAMLGGTWQPIGYCGLEAIPAADSPSDDPFN